MLDFQSIVSGVMLENWRDEYTATLYAPPGYRITGGGYSLSFTSTTSGTQACVGTPIANMPFPEYGADGEDAWRTTIRFNNTNRGVAVLTVRAVCVKEVTPPPPEDGEPPVEDTPPADDDD